ncbi:MAG: DUF2510 domain-containing protein [Acidimicrobiales bacterium]
MWGVAPILATSTSLTSGQVDELWLAAVVSGVLAYLFAAHSKRSTGSYPWRLPPMVWGLLGVLIPVLSLLLEGVARLTTRPVPPPVTDPYTTGTLLHAPRLPGQPEQAPPNPGWSPPAQGLPGAPNGQWQLPVTSDPPQPPPATSWPSTPFHGAPGAPPWPPPLGPEAFEPLPPGQVPASRAPLHQGAPPYAAVPKPAMLDPDGGAKSLSYGPAPTPPPLFGWYPDPTGRHEQRYWDGRHWSHRVSNNSVRTNDPLHHEGDPAASGPQEHGEAPS